MYKKLGLWVLAHQLILAHPDGWWAKTQLHIWKLVNAHQEKKTDFCDWAKT